MEVGQEWFWRSKRCSGTASVNLSNGAAGSGNAGLRIGENNSSSGITNLIGGSLTINRMIHNGATNSAAVFNFHGGLLIANSSQTTFIPTSMSGGSPNSHVFVWSEGANINDGGFSATIAAGLEAPTGSGITSISMAGTGFVEALIVQITGDGFGATPRWRPLIRPLGA